MKKLMLGLLAGLTLFGGVSTIAGAKTSVQVYLGEQAYQSPYQPAYHTDNREKLVCLVTFFRKSQVGGGADANVESARVLPLRVARRLDRPYDRNRIFDYGSNRQTIRTCRYLNNLHNEDRGDNEELVCLVTFFTRDQVGGGADADVERARLLPRPIAESRDGPNDRNRIFVYGSNQKTRETCRYLDGINN